MYKMQQRTDPLQKRGITGIALIMLIVILLLCPSCDFDYNLPSEEQSRQELTVHYIDVGQGDSELLLLPNGKNMLIDAGDNAAENDVVDYIRSQGITTLDYVIATHPHADHIGGMDKVIESFDIGNFYMPRLPDEQLPTTRSFEDMLTAIDENSITPIQAKSGLEICSDGDLMIEFLSPTRSKYEEVNHYSAVVMVHYGNCKLLFMGDAENGNEKDIIKKGYNLQADVLKVGHHGSRKASSNDFLKAVHPDYAIISCGKGNDYGHPHSEALKRLKRNKVDVYRTDLNSTIVLHTDGYVTELLPNKY